MRTRLLGSFVTVVAILVLGLGIPLALTFAQNLQSVLFADRSADTSRYASLSQRLLEQGGTDSGLLDQLRSYYEVYGISIAVFDRGDQDPGGAFQTQEASPGPGIDPSDAVVHRDLVNARAGRGTQQGALLMPWDGDPMVVAEPVLVNGEVRGVVVTSSPTEHTRTLIWLSWAAILVGGVLAVGLAVLVALPLVRWMLRPVLLLDNATAALLPAIVNGRKVDPVGGDIGPPELRRLTRSFDQMAVSVSDVLAAQRAFVADASHQLRNPLTALRIRLSNLEGHVDPDVQEQQSAALEEADRLNRILDELLSMARAESSSVDPIAVDVDQAVSARLRAWQAVATAKGVALVLDGEPGGTALAPPRGVETVLDALLDNALKFTGDDTIVTVEVHRRDGRVRLAVRDHGPGLQEDELERATDRFWRSAAHQNVRGSGLGLAIVRLLVERVGGAIMLDLPEGGGLRVTFDLPAL
ncbi:HAMP domain-containing sensor histidine kinase [Kutzneria buriramensis]|uniref:histidine kinase n=1 Tax=Kutzneria buriramensis TaxID=1045776 RepID=A0A3E0HZ28_9PSEU|nr:HAMP domain-containing sensor histidine kinase [Kutzneria buriramensis]REH51727.1 signal transduction histidine kinase [Kutzneria buriramensis]